MKKFLKAFAIMIVFSGTDNYGKFAVGEFKTLSFYQL